jgi:hypothetical protein
MSHRYSDSRHRNEDVNSSDESDLRDLDAKACPGVDVVSREAEFPGQWRTLG